MRTLFINASRFLIESLCLLLTIQIVSGCERNVNLKGWTNLGSCIVCLDHLPTAVYDDSTGLRRKVIYMEKRKISLFRPKPIVVIDSTADDSYPFYREDLNRPDFEEEYDDLSDSLTGPLPHSIIIEITRDYDLYAKLKGNTYQYALYHQSEDHPLIHLVRSEGWGESLYGQYHGFNYKGITKKGDVIYARIPNIGLY